MIEDSVKVFILKFALIFYGVEMKILITGGGSEEKIDNVRSICNFSTGRTSSFLSTFFVEKGFSVSLITSHRSVMPENKNVNVYKYESFSE